MIKTQELYDFLVRIQAIAKIGLTYSKDDYALTNYKEINDLSTKFLEKFMEVKLDRPNYFVKDTYPTPAISVRTIIFSADRTKVLMVREVNSHQYSLPGGWAELYDSPSETAINESFQEAGADIKVVRLVGILNRTPFKNPTTIPEYCIIFEGQLMNKLHEHEYETDDVGFFDINNLPEISRKTSMTELMRMINAAKNNETIFD